MAAPTSAVPLATPKSPHPSRPKSKTWPVEFYSSAVGKKWVMGLTGIMMIGFVLMHMVGNLKVYLGAGDFNHYAEFLRHLLVPILPRTVLSHCRRRSMRPSTSSTAANRLHRPTMEGLRG